MRVKRDLTWAVMLLVVPALLAGCDRLPYRGGSYERTVPNHPSTEVLRLREVGWEDIPVAPLAPAWEKTYDQVVTAALAEDGSAVAANVSLTVGRSTGLGYELFDPAGEAQARVVFVGDRYRASSVWLLANGRWVAATMTNYDQRGYFSVYDAGGQRVLARSVTGWAVGAGSRGGSRVAVLLQPLSQAQGQLHLFDTGGWRELASFRMRPEAVVQFSREGTLLISDGERIRLIDERGSVLAEYRVPAAVRPEVAMAPSGDLVAATTGQGDSRVYLFSRSGEPVFEELLFVGGTNRLVFSEDERWLAVYDVGERGGIYLFEVATGHLLWRSMFRLPEGKSVSVRRLALDPVTGRVAAEVVLRAAGSAVEDHHLYLASAEGEPLARIPLGENLNVHLDGMARVAVVTTNNLADWQDRVRNHLRWYNLVSLPPLEGVSP